MKWTSLNIDAEKGYLVIVKELIVELMLKNGANDFNSAMVYATCGKHKK